MEFFVLAAGLLCVLIFIGGMFLDDYYEGDDD